MVAPPLSQKGKPSASNQAVKGLNLKSEIQNSKFLSIRGLIFVLLLCVSTALAAPPHRTNLVEAVLSEDLARQTEIIKSLVTANDPLVEQALIAWRGGALYVLETNDTKVPVLLDAATDGEGSAKAVRLLDGEFVKGADGKPQVFAVADLTAADAASKLRKVIKATLDLSALGNVDPKMRRDAAIKLGQEQNADYLPFFETLQKTEQNKEVVKALGEAVATTQLTSDDEPARLAAIEQLRAMRSINGLNFLQTLDTSAKAAPAKYGEKTLADVHRAIHEIEQYMW